MTTASEYLASIVQQARQYSPSITVAHLQRNELPPGYRNWKPGIGGYGWGINGRVVNDGNGAPTGLRFGVEMWFSDRRTNPSATPPDWQQFSAKAKDDQRITLTPSGNNVDAEIVLLTWGSARISTTSFAFEEASKQMLFVIPGAGPGAPQAVMVLALHPTGEFGFL